MEPNLVSTVIPVFNRPNMLEEAVRSVLAQTYRPIEVVIVDDGSTDETPGVADRLSDSCPKEIRVLHIPNSGPGLAREAGRQMARGEFIQYLDSDDLLLPKKFEVQVEALSLNPGCGVAYGYTRLVAEDGAVLAAPHKWTGRSLPTLFPWLLVDRWWSTHTPLFRRAVCDAIGPWSDMRMSEDWEYEARVGSLGTRLIHCPEYLSDTRSHPGIRLARGNLDRGKIHDICRLNQTLFRSALAAGVALDSPEMRHFARSAFLVARRAGAAALPVEAKESFELAVSATEPAHRNRRSLALYSFLASGLGWTLAGKVSWTLGRLIRKKPGPETLKKSTELG